MSRILSDFKPRKYDAGMYHLFANYAALAIQEIEAVAKGPLPEPDIDSACKFLRPSMSMPTMLPSRYGLCCWLKACSTGAPHHTPIWPWRAKRPNACPGCNPCCPGAVHARSVGRRAVG